jgi:hypothetical protein
MEVSQRIPKPSRHARNGQSEREAGRHAAARAGPAVNTRRGAVEGGSERASEELSGKELVLRICQIVIHCCKEKHH